VKNSKCKEFVTMDLRWWPNLKSIAERCNVPQYCLITANTELLKKYARPDGTFLPKMKGKRMNIGCFHRSMY
jgi:L-rhamnose mutarotase